MKNFAAFLGAASLAMALPAAPAHAGGDITNFNVKNCTQQRMFVCSFDKTDGSLKIPYKAAGIQPGDRKEFGCASLDKCKVIIGVSKKTTTNTVSTGVETALVAGTAATATVGAAVGAWIGVGTAAAIGINTPLAALAAAGGFGAVVVGGVIAAIGSGAIGGIEIADGWSDGEVCNQVRRKAQKAGYKPKLFMKNGKKYQVIEQYALDESKNPYIYADGSAVMTYTIEQGKGKCPAALNKQLIPG